MNVGVSDLSNKSYSRKLLKKFKNFKPYKKNSKRASSSLTVTN